jgi:Rrf2 family protein
MQITKQADYAVRAVLYLARLEPGGRAATGQIARDQNIPASFLAKIVAQLGAAGLLRATRGVRGGVSLARAPECISLLQVVESIDGPISLNSCVADPSICPLSSDCQVRTVWAEAQFALVQKLSMTNFKQLSLSPA